MKILVEVGGRTLSGTLDDTAAARDFGSLLPIALIMDDYARTEKIADLPKRLSIAGAPAGATPTAGDICYYAPWGNLALFYRGAAHARGLVQLGRLVEGVETLVGAGPLSVNIRVAGD